MQSTSLTTPFIWVPAFPGMTRLGSGNLRILTLMPLAGEVNAFLNLFLCEGLRLAVRTRVSRPSSEFPRTALHFAGQVAQLRQAAAGERLWLAAPGMATTVV